MEISEDFTIIYLVISGIALLGTIVIAVATALYTSYSRKNISELKEQRVFLIKSEQSKKIIEIKNDWFFGGYKDSLENLKIYFHKNMKLTKEEIQEKLEPGLSIEFNKDFKKVIDFIERLNYFIDNDEVKLSDLILYFKEMNGGLEQNYFLFYRTMIWVLKNFDIADTKERIISVNIFFKIVSDFCKFKKLRKQINLNS